jgi:hypothetical protein
MTEQNRQVAGNEEPEFAAFVAIDWADQTHYWSLRAAGSKQIERGDVENTPPIRSATGSSGNHSSYSVNSKPSSRMGITL